MRSARSAEIFAELEQQGAEEFAAEGLKGAAQRTLDLRYRRQGYELNVAYDPRDAGAVDRGISSRCISSDMDFRMRRGRLKL